MTSGRPYQGFPYVQPAVVDAPSLSASEVAALSKWRDLPTRKITTQTVGQVLFEKTDGKEALLITFLTDFQKAPDQHKIEDQHAVYTDPKTDGTSDNLYPHYPSQKLTPKQNDEEPEPVIYIDIPEDSFSGSSVSEGGINSTKKVNYTNGASDTSGGNSVSRLNETRGENRWVTNRVNGNKAKECASSGYEDNDEIEPVVYIDIPESNESNVSQRIAAAEQRIAAAEQEPDYVEQTIYYNPFKESKTDNGDEEAGSTSQPGCSQRPWPSNSLNHTFPGSSRTENAGLPPFLSKESYVYGSQPSPDDDFSLSPLPLNEFPQPPPSYEEAARSASTPQRSEIRPDPAPPRTQVIVHSPENSAVTQADLERQLLHCQHCNKRVISLVVKETGVLTHVFAWAFMFVCLFPITFGIYCTDTFKYRNHYCPNCNKKIGYEVPFLCMGMQYVHEE